MAIQIKSTKDTITRGIKIAVYGNAGTGKTVLCSTAPNPLIVSAENGLLSLSRKDIPYTEVTKYSDIDKIYDFVKSKDCKFDTICVDSISEIAEVILVDFKKDEKDPRQAYQKMADAMMHMIRNFRDIPDKNIVFTSKLRLVEDEASGLIIHVPMIPGKVVGQQLPYMFDEVFCLQVEKDGKRYLQTGVDRQRSCKDRSGVLDQKEPADLTYIINKVKGEQNGNAPKSV